MQIETKSLRFNLFLFLKTLEAAVKKKKKSTTFLFQLLCQNQNTEITA